MAEKRPRKAPAKARKPGGGRPIKPRLHPNSGLWFACIGPPGSDGRASREYFPRETVTTEREAWSYLEKRLEALAAKVVPIADVSFYWLCQMYLQDCEAKKRDTNDTPESDDGMISPANYANKVSALTLAWETEPALGAGPLKDRPAGKIQPEDIDGCVAAWRRAGYSPGYIRSLVKTIRSAYRWGSRPVSGREPLRIIDVDPLAAYSPPKRLAAPDRFVEGVVVRRFLRWAWAQARSWETKALSRRFDRLFLLLFRFCVLTGCRPKEACRLKWSHIDRRLNVATFPGKTTWKTGKSRVVHITPPVWRVLGAIEALPGHHAEYVFTHMEGKRNAAQRADSDPVAGEPWPDGSAVSKKLRKLRLDAIAAGVKGLEKVGPKRLVMYTHRHNYASAALMSGLTTSEAAELLGNTAEVIQSTYGHIQTAHTAKLASKMATNRGRSGGD